MMMTNDDDDDDDGDDGDDELYSLAPPSTQHRTTVTHTVREREREKQGQTPHNRACVREGQRETRRDVLEGETS